VENIKRIENLRIVEMDREVFDTALGYNQDSVGYELH